MRSIALVTALACTSLAAHAQSMQNMQGMNMPSAPQPQKKTQPKPDHSAAPSQVPQDMARPNATPSAQGAKSSLENSIEQQKGQQGVTPATGADAGSLTRDIYTLQEPEAADLQTGSVRSTVPDLLAGVVTRKPMSLDDLLALAMQRNPTLAAARSSVDRSRGQARQAGMLPDPSVGYSGEHIRGGEYGGGEQGGYVSQQFVLGGKLGLRRGVLEGEARANQVGVEEQTARVRSDVSQAFYRALAAQAMVAVQQRLLRVAMDASETAHQLSNVGQADAPDVLTAELETEQAKIDLVHAEREFMACFAVLTAEAGAPELPVSPLTGDIEKAPALNADQQVAAILAASPTVHRAEAEAAVAEARVKSEKREPVPDLTVRAGEWYSGERIESSGRPAGPMSFVDAGIKLPLWNRNQGDIAAAQADVVRAQAEVRRTQLALQHDAAPLVQEYASAQFEAMRYREELLPRARRAYELYLMKYQQMAQAYPQVLVSQRTLFLLQGAYLQALARQWTAAVALQNFTLSGGLGQPRTSGGMTAVTTLPGGGSD